MPPQLRWVAAGRQTNLPPALESLHLRPGVGPHLGLMAPAAGPSVGPTRLRFISKKRTGSLPGTIRSPTSRHAPSLMTAVKRIVIGPAGISHTKPSAAGVNLKSPTLPSA